MKIVLSVAIFLVIAAAVFMVAAGLPFGAPLATDMDAYFLANGQAQTGANNIVTGVLFDYRGLDTLGEATVLFTAVLGVGALFRRLNQDEEADA
jgi:multisubunit Na+/H+ antiporter MnhB subunit